jgi:hypothetical protein
MCLSCQKLLCTSIGPCLKICLSNLLPTLLSSSLSINGETSQLPHILIHWKCQPVCPYSQSHQRTQRKQERNLIQNWTQTQVERLSIGHWFSKSILTIVNSGWWRHVHPGWQSIVQHVKPFIFVMLNKWVAKTIDYTGTHR